MAEYGAEVNHLRETYVSDLAPKTNTMLNVLSEQLPEITIRFKRGWSGPELLEYFAGNPGSNHV